VLQVKFLAEVDAARCTGCTWCEKVCLTDTIAVRDRVARVDDACLACGRCEDVCTALGFGAIAMVRRAQRRLVRTDPGEVDAGELAALCAEAHRRPDELVCICALTLAGEIGAAVLKGARSFKEVALASGVLQGCQEFCVPVVQRLLKAKGVDVTSAGSFLSHDQTLSMWDLSPEARRKFDFFIEEDLELATRNR